MLKSRCWDYKNKGKTTPTFETLQSGEQTDICTKVREMWSVSVRGKSQVMLRLDTGQKTTSAWVTVRGFSEEEGDFAVLQRRGCCTERTCTKISTHVDACLASLNNGAIQGGSI